MKSYVRLVYTIKASIKTNKQTRLDQGFDFDFVYCISKVDLKMQVDRRAELYHVVGRHSSVQTTTITKVRFVGISFLFLTMLA